MSDFKIETIYEPTVKTPLVDIVLVHGLGGDALGTWKHKNDSFWPKWLSETMPLLRILFRDLGQLGKVFWSYEFSHEFQIKCHHFFQVVEWDL